MKALVVVVLLVLAGLVAYNLWTTGEVRLLPRQATAAEREIEGLQNELAAARQRFETAVAKARQSGADVAAQVSTARREVERIEKRLTAAIARLQGGTKAEVNRWSARAAERAQALKRAVEAFKRELE